MGDVRRLVVNSAVLLLISLAGYVLVLETRKVSVTVEPLEVPETLQKMGFTPRVAAQYLIEEVYEIQDGANTRIERLLLEAEWSAPDLVLPSGGISVKSTAAYLRGLLGLRRQVVTGEIVQNESDDRLSLRLRINGRRVPKVPEEIPVSQGRTSTSPVAVSIEQLFVAGARDLVFELEPYVLALYYYEHDRPSTRRLLSYILVKDPGSDDGLRASNLQGVLYHHDDRFDDAIEMYEKVVELDPEYVSGYINWGLALEGKGEYDAAIEKYRRATDLDPEKAAAYHSWGLALYRKGEYDPAIEKYRRATELDPEYANAYSNWGSALYRKGEYDAAIAMYRRATELDPEHADAYDNWARALAAKGAFEASREKSQKAKELRTGRAW